MSTSVYLGLALGLVSLALNVFLLWRGTCRCAARVFLSPALPLTNVVVGVAAETVKKGQLVSIVMGPSDKEKHS